MREKSDGINASLCERRERIEELNGTRSLLRKVQVSLYILKRRVEIYYMSYCVDLGLQNTIRAFRA